MTIMTALRFRLSSSTGMRCLVRPAAGVSSVPFFPSFPSSLFPAQEKAHIVTVRSINIFNQESSNDGDIAPYVAEAGHRAGRGSRVVLFYLWRSGSLRAA